MKAQYITPAITVFDEKGELDLESQGRLYEYLIEGGVNGILLLGSIGEFFALTMEQKIRLVAFAAQAVKGRVRLLVNITSMVFDETVKLGQYALEAGAEGVMAVPPYYFWLDQEGVERYYDRLASQIEGKLYLYNFPDRTGYSIAPGTVLTLKRRHPQLAGIKDTLAGVDHTREIIRMVKSEFPDFEVFSGFDDNFAHNILAGGDGCIGGLSNVAPKLFADWVKAFEREDVTETAKIQRTVDRLMEIYSVGIPFVPFIKKAVQLKGVNLNPRSTFPLPEVSSEQEERLRQIMKDNQLL